MKITLHHLTKKFGGVTAVDDVNLEVRDGEFVALLGPSGCGKTTTLLMLAGIYRPTSGEILFDDQVINDLLPRDRNVGMVFQSYALYSHMTVFQNIAYPLRLKRTPRAETEARVRRVAQLLQIQNLLDRKPGQLSGGQQQRVALGRALVKEPAILLFDEPLSNLDARLRLTMRAELKRLQRDLGITSVYVTHDQVEAMTMADRVAVMRLGKLEAYAAPDELYNRPQTQFVAGFIGNPPMNLFEATLERTALAAGSSVRGAGHLPAFRLVAPGIELAIPDEAAVKALRGSERRAVVAGIRPEDIHVDGSPDGYPSDALLSDVQAEIYVVEPLGRDHLLDCRINDSRWLVLARPDLSRKPGDQLRLWVDTRKIQLFDLETGRSLLWGGFDGASRAVA